MSELQSLKEAGFPRLLAFFYFERLFCGLWGDEDLNEEIEESGAPQLHGDKPSFRISSRENPN